MIETILLYRNNSNSYVQKISFNSFKSMIIYKLFTHKWYI